MHLSKSQSEIVQLAEVIHFSADATERTHSGMIEGECRDGTAYIKLIIIYIYSFFDCSEIESTEKKRLKNK